MPRVCIVALIGLPAAGKTTFCQQLFALKRCPLNIAHLCYDNLLQLNAVDINNQNASLEIGMKAERLKILALLQTTVEAITCKNNQVTNVVPPIPTIYHDSEDYVILCDDNNYYTSMRYKIYQLCKANYVYFAQIYFPISLSKSLKRNAQRKLHMQVPQNIIEQMCARLEPPNTAKNYWESYTLIAGGNTWHGDFAFASTAFLHFITDVFQNALFTTLTDPKAKDQHTCSPLHHLDVLLRRRIKEILEALTVIPANKKMIANKLNAKRKKILQNYSKCKASEIESFNLDQLNDICKLLN